MDFWIIYDRKLQLLIQTKELLIKTSFKQNSHKTTEILYNQNNLKETLYPINLLESPYNKGICELMRRFK